MSDENLEWAVEPSNDHTNYCFSGELPAENAMREVKDNKGKPHNIWLCPSRKKVQEFWDSRISQDLNFRVYNRLIHAGGRSRGPIKDVTFLFERKILQKKNPEIQKVREQLKSITK